MSKKLNLKINPIGRPKFCGPMSDIDLTGEIGTFGSPVPPIAYADLKRVYDELMRQEQKKETKDIPHEVIETKLL